MVRRRGAPPSTFVCLSRCVSSRSFHRLQLDRQVVHFWLHNLLVIAVAHFDRVGVRACFEHDVISMPPFGNFYGLPTYVDRDLAEQDYIVFEAGTHTDAIKMSYRDYEKIVKPEVKDLAIKLQPMKGA